MSKSTSRKKYGFSYESNEKFFEEVVDLGYENSFHSPTSEHLLQMTVFEKMVEFYIFYRDPNKCFSPLFPYMIGEKLKQFVKECTKKKN